MWEQYIGYSDMNPSCLFYHIRHNYTDKNRKHPLQYRGKFCCFDCRIIKKTQSRMRRVNDSRGYIMSFQYEILGEKPPTCPKCNKELTLIGSKFRAPKHNDIRSWENAKKIFNQELDYNKKKSMNYQNWSIYFDKTLRPFEFSDNEFYERMTIKNRTK
jgi:hypothetical protein